MKKTLSNYIGITLIGFLLLNAICCISTLLFQTPTKDDLFLFVWFDMVFSILISGLIYNSITRKNYYETNA